MLNSASVDAVYFYRDDKKMKQHNPNLQALLPTRGTFSQYPKVVLDKIKVYKITKYSKMIAALITLHKY